LKLYGNKKARLLLSVIPMKMGIYLFPSSNLLLLNREGLILIFPPPWRGDD